MVPIAELFQRAVQHHQGGNLAQADTLYRQVLQSDPANHEAYHLLGLLAHQAGHHDAATTLLRQAIALNPVALPVYFNLGIVLLSQGKVTEAAQCFDNVLKLDPAHVEALINLGNIHLGEGRDAEARSCYERAVQAQPQHADAQINLGNALLRQDRYDEAVACYRQALHINPLHAHAHDNFGNALMSRGHAAAALVCFEEALRLDPANTRFRDNLMRALREHGDALAQQQQFADAAACFQKALALSPTSVELHNRLGRVLFWQGNFAEAAACNREALRLEPKNAEALNNLGLALRDQGEFAQAADCFQQALDNDFGQGVALWNRCLLSLMHGDFAGGWPDFDQRLALPGAVARSFAQPRWDGSPLAGKTILVYAELGLGDTIHFARFLPLVKARGGKVIFECQPALCHADESQRHGFMAMAGVDQLVAAGSALPAFDVQIPLLSLPALFGTTLATIPNDVPYLVADPTLIEYWRGQLATSPAGSFSGNRPFTVGIAWQANLSHQGHRFKSVPLRFFEPLSRLDNIRLVSLQVGPGAAQLSAAPFLVEDLGSRFDPNSLDDLAATMVNLDLIISIDTAVPHLAGALGVPVWVALPFVACWRWQLNRDDSPWYPSMRLFRQKALGAWAEVFERIAAELQKTRGEHSVPLVS